MRSEREIRLSFRCFINERLQYMSERKKQGLDLTQGKVGIQILKFIWPVLLASMFQQLYNLSNQYIVGNFVNEDTLSAVSACSVITGIYTQMFSGLGLGTGIVISNYYGAKNIEKVKESVETAILMAVVGGTGLTILSEISIPLFMRMININEVLYPIAYDYLRVYVIGSVFVMTYNICFYIMRSIGDTKHPLYYLIVSSILNIILGILFVRVFNFKVIGTALATIIAQFVVDVLCMILIMKNEITRFDFGKVKFNPKALKEICRLGIPAGIQNTLIGFSGVVIQSYTNLFPNEVIAGVGVGQRVSHYAQMPLHAIQSAATAYIGQNYGAKKYDRVREGLKFCLNISNLISIVLCSIIFIFARPLVAMFNRNPDIVRYGVEMVRYTVYSTIFIGWSHIYNGTCRAAGNVREPLIIAIFSHFVVRYVFVTIAFKIAFSVVNIYYASVIGSAFAGVLAFLYFHLSRWTKENHLRV